VVYVGGIVVLIIFSIFLTQQAGDKMPAQKLGRTLFSALAAFLGFALTLVQVVQHTCSCCRQRRSRYRPPDAIGR
jgi:NADH-quinone oxidoreductase subunit J